MEVERNLRYGFGCLVAGKRRTRLVPPKCDSVSSWHIYGRGQSLHSEGLDMSESQKLIIRFALVAEQPSSRDEDRLSHNSSENSIAGIKRYTGFVRGRDLYPLFDHGSLEANPRSAKAGNVTDDILKTLEDTPE